LVWGALGRRWTVEFDFVQAGVRHVYEVTRSWVAAAATPSSIDVSLDLRQDGQRLDDLDHTHWDDFLKEFDPARAVAVIFLSTAKRFSAWPSRTRRNWDAPVKSLLNSTR